MKIKAVTLSLLILAVFCDNLISLDCSPCNGSVCISFSGSYFNSYTTKISGYASCSAYSNNTNFPTHVQFTCNSNCSQGCLIAENGETSCSSDSSAMVKIRSLPLLYTVHKHSSAVDLCHCSDEMEDKISTCAIVGIIVGGFFLVAILVGLLIYLWKRNRKIV